jgi:uncharacterized protein YjdB
MFMNTTDSNHKKFRRAAVITLSGLTALSGIMMAPEAQAASRPAQVQLVQAQLEAQNSSTSPDASDSADAQTQRTIKLTWKASSGASYYRVYVSDKKDSGYKRSGGNFKDTSAEVAADAGKVVYLKVRAYKGSSSSSYSVPVSVSTTSDSDNAAKVTLSKEKATIYIRHSSTLKASADGKLSETTPIRWYSSNSSVASVSSSGKVTAKKKGSAEIYAIAHNGVSSSAKVTVPGYKKVTVPNVVGKSKTSAAKALKKAGLKSSVGKTSFVTASTLKSKYPSYDFKDVVRQSAKAGSKVNENSTVSVSILDEIPDEGTGVEAMVRWAEDIANDNRFGYSLGVYTSLKSDRFDPFTVSGASLDYDCASFVTAALAHSGMGSDFVRACKKPPIVGGVVTLLKQNDWKLVKVNGKTPSISQLKRGDILVNPSYHIEIYDGNKMDVGAHWDWDGKTGDSSGQEINIRPTSKFSHGYTAVYRYYGDIENDLKN